MFTRLRNWIERSRERKREKWEDEHGNLSKEDERVVSEYRPGAAPPEFSTKGFDETSRR